MSTKQVVEDISCSWLWLDQFYPLFLVSENSCIWQVIWWFKVALSLSLSHTLSFTQAPTSLTPSHQHLWQWERYVNYWCLSKLISLYLCKVINTVVVNIIVFWFLEVERIPLVNEDTLRWRTSYHKHTANGSCHFVVKISAKSLLYFFFEHFMFLKGSITPKVEAIQACFVLYWPTYKCILWSISILLEIL